MAFASVGSFGTANSTTSGTTLALTPTATLEVGNLAILIVTMDNEGQEITVVESGRLHDTCQSITDTQSNIWRCIGTNADSRATDAGSAVAVFACRITTQLTTSDTITATFKLARTSKAMISWEYTVGSEVNIESIVRRYDLNADCGSLTLDDLPNREYLLIRGIAYETNTSTDLTVTTNFTRIDQAVANTGTAASSMTANGEFRIATGTSFTSDPTKGSADNCSIFIALFEGDPTIPVVTHAGLAQSGTGAISPIWPKPHRAGDIALLICEATGGETISLSTAAGFVEVTNSPQNTSETKLAVFWCRATSNNMSTPTVADPGNHLAVKMLLIQQANTNGNPWDLTVGSAKDTPSTSVSITGGTTTVDNDLIIAIASEGTDTVSDEFSSWANSDLTRVKELDCAMTVLGTGGGWYAAIGRKATAGSVGATTATLVTSSDNSNLFIAIRPLLIPATVATVVTIPTPTIDVPSGTTVTPAVVATVIAVPTPAVLAASVVAPAVIPLTTTVPTPTPQVPATVTPAVVATVVALPLPTVLAASRVTPAVVATVTTIPTPQPSIPGVAAPAVIPLVTTIPTPTVTVPATVTPAAVAIVVALPTPAVLAASRVTPATVVTAVSAPTPTPSIPATVTPAAVSLVTTVPTPTPSIPATVTPATVATVAAIATPTILAASVVTPATVATSISAPTPAVLAASRVSPAVVPLTTTIPAPTALGAAVVAPQTVAMVVSVPQPAISAAATVTPASVALVTDLPAPSIVAGGAGAATPAVVPVVASIPTPSILAGAVVTPAVVSASISIPTPAIAVSPTALPAVIPLTLSVPTPTIDVAGGPVTVSPATVALITTVPTPQPSIPASVSPATVPLIVAIPVPDITLAMTVAPAVIATLISLPQPSITAAALVAPNGILLLTAIPTPTAFMAGVVTDQREGRDYNGTDRDYADGGRVYTPTGRSHSGGGRDYRGGNREYR